MFFQIKAYDYFISEFNGTRHILEILTLYFDHFRYRLYSSFLEQSTFLENYYLPFHPVSISGQGANLVAKEVCPCYLGLNQNQTIFFFC